MQSIILNSSNYVENSDNIFRYNFPQGVNFQNSKIGLQSISIFNSTFNISDKLQNNKFTIAWNAYWFNNSIEETRYYNFTIPDGYYNVASLNYFLQTCMIDNNLYFIPNSSLNTRNHYFIEILQNASKYALQLNIFALPSYSVYSDTNTIYEYTTPPNSTWRPSTASVNPQVIMCEGSMKFFGFKKNYNDGNYITINSNLNITTSTPFLELPKSTNLAINKAFLSNISPTVNPVNSYIMTCNLLNNTKYSSQSDIMYSIPLTKSFGEMIIINNSNIIYNQIRDGFYQFIQIEFLDNNLNKLYLLDHDLVIILSIIEN